MLGEGSGQQVRITQCKVKARSKRNSMKIPQTLFMEWLQDVHKMDLDEFITILGKIYEARVYGGGYYVD